MPTLKITGDEAKTHLIIYKKSSALLSIKYILTHTPERIDEFDLPQSKFANLDADIANITNEYTNWCNNMRMQYGLSFDKTFKYSIDYVLKTITYSV